MPHARGGAGLHALTGRPDGRAAGDLAQLKNKPFTIKEGCEYRLKITFFVQRDVVAGLKYLQAVKRGVIRADKSEMMVGSYGPSATAQVFTGQVEEAPKGPCASAAAVAAPGVGAPGV